jgi:nitrogen fixation protein FixH
MFRLTVLVLGTLLFTVPFVVAQEAMKMPTSEMSNTKADPSKLAITFKTTPTPPKTGSNQFEVTVKDAAGKPVADADVSVLFVMPAMPAMKMPEMRKETKLKAAGDGKYTGTGEVMMAGMWNVTVSAKQKGKQIGSLKQSVTAK